MVIVPNEAETESLLLRLNLQLPAFLLNYLPKHTDMPREFVETLLKKLCDAQLINKSYNCKWDEDSWVVTRPDDENAQQKEAERTKDKWYANIVSNHLAVNQTPLRPHTAAQALYDLDAEKSVTTIHTKKKSSRKQATTDLQKRRDGDSSDEDTTDSASINAPTKPFSRVGTH